MMPYSPKRRRLKARLLSVRSARPWRALSVRRGFAGRELHAYGRPTATVLLFLLVVLVGWYAPSFVGGGHELKARPFQHQDFSLAADLAFYSANATPELSASDRRGRLVFRVDLTRGLPPTWKVDGDARVVATREGISLSLRAGSLRGRGVRLGKGRYEALVDADVARGGIQVGLFDGSAAAACHGNAFIASGESRHAIVPLGFNVSTPKTFYVNFSSWSPSEQTSSVIIRSLSFYEVSHLVRKATLIHYYKRRATSSLQTSSINSDVQHRWLFTHGLSKDWRVTSDTDLIADDANLTVHTGPTNGYSLESPFISAYDPSRRRYVVSVKGRVLRGGMRVGVLDSKRNVFVAQGLFWAGARKNYQDEYAFLVHAPPKTKQFRLVLGNWTPVRQASTWIIENVTVALLSY
jgi:hypothetical protein